MNPDLPDTMFLHTMQGRPLKSVNPKYALEHWGAWFAQALEALAWLHAHGIMHGFLDATSLRIDETTHTLKLYMRKVSNEAAHEPFNPKHSIYPPEFLLKQAYGEGLSCSTAYEALEAKNANLELCETQLDLDYSFRTFQILWKYLEVHDPYKADVWMVGASFLRIYLEFLTWPGVVVTDFYRHDNERFISCLARMLEAYPAKRITAEAALHTWSPSFILYPEETDADLPSLVEDTCAPSNSDQEETESLPLRCLVAANAANAANAASVPLSLPLTLSQPSETEPVPPKPRRLVLSGYRDSVAHNKTRRSPRNSGLIPAIHNPVKNTQG